MSEISDIPARSILFHIQPLGLASSQVESLTGYIERLASAHLLTPATLLHRYLAWWESNSPDMVGTWKRRTDALPLRASINAHTTGIRWIEVLQHLTCTTELASCTIHSWASLFPKRRLLKNHLTWCPACFAEDAEPYNRLIWNLTPTSVCPRHRCILVERCPKCGSQVPIIHARSVPNHCPKCSAQLASNKTSLIPADDRECAASEIVQDFLVEVSKSPKKPWQRSASIPETLSRCIRASGISDAAELARLAHVSRITAWYWCNGKSVPDLLHTVSLCQIFGISISNFLAGRIPKRLTLFELPNASRSSRRRPGRLFNVVQIERQITALRNDLKLRPPSLTEVAETVGFSCRVIRRHLPNTCREISKHHQVYLKQQLTARRAAMTQSFKDAIHKCWSEKGSSQRSDIVTFLPKPGVLRSSVARNIFNQLLLNLEP